MNILQATMTGMRRALCALSPAAQLARIDGNRLPRGLPCPAEAIIGGDGIEPAIMAASILAKVARDHAMCALHLAISAIRIRPAQRLPEPRAPRRTLGTRPLPPTPAQFRASVAGLQGALKATRDHTPVRTFTA